MKDTWIPLASIPAGGCALTLDDQTLWEIPLSEFSLPCRIVSPLRAEVTVLPQEDGVLFRGLLTGEVALPCDRCAEDSRIVLRQAFDSFEPYPAEALPLPPKGKSAGAKAAAKEDAGEDALEVDAAVIRLAPHGRGVEINPAALVWEEFSLALPIKPLCSENCKGLCPSCGGNRNRETCTCDTSPGDPRLGKLRGLTITKK